MFLSNNPITFIGHQGKRKYCWNVELCAKLGLENLEVTYFCRNRGRGHR